MKSRWLVLLCFGANATSLSLVYHRNGADQPPFWPWGGQPLVNRSYFSLGVSIIAIDSSG